jgi:hypothetical protein
MPDPVAASGEIVVDICRRQRQRRGLEGA